LRICADDEDDTDDYKEGAGEEGYVGFANKIYGLF
jgi:hypothetical protein